MGTDDLANWLFAYVLIGTMIWALMYAGGLLEKTFQSSRGAVMLVSIGSIFGWPVLVCVFLAAVARGRRQRSAR